MPDADTVKCDRIVLSSISNDVLAFFKIHLLF
jgi:hypothetical protein